MHDRDQSALKAAGLTTIDELRFAENDKQSVAAVEANLKANPKTVTIFAVDSMTAGVIRDVVKNDVSHRFFVAGCYASDEFKSDLTRIVQIGALAELRHAADAQGDLDCRFCCSRS